MNRQFIAVGMIIVLLIIGLSGCIEQENGGEKSTIDGGFGSGVIIIPAVTGSVSDNPKLAMASYYKSDEFVINSSVALYELPLDITQITNFDDIITAFNPSDNQKILLENNGFFVMEYGVEDDIIQPYKDLKENYNVPIFITSDTLLHLYHIQFDEILKGIEEREFFDKILNLSKALFDEFKENYVTFTDNDLKEAAKRNVAYFSVGLSLLQTATEDYNDTEDICEVSFTIPSYVQSEVENETGLIEAHGGFSPSLIFKYKEDYSQYVPRGHYTQSEKLKRYFKALMWYGRMGFLMKGGEPSCQECEYLISEEDAKIQTMQASLIANALPSVTVNDENVEELWNRIYIITSFFVGTSDDLSPYEYLDCIQKVYGLSFNTTELTNDVKLLDLKVNLSQLRSPEIYGGTGECVIYPPITKEKLYEVLEKTKGMRLMGQRFIPDSYMFQQLVSPAVGMYTGENCDESFTCEPTQAGPARCFPRGLDIMAVLGSERAYEILKNEGDTDYEGINTSYDKQLELLRKNFSQLNITEWNRNLYYSWIFMLKSLLTEFNNSYPTFMQTSAWLDKELQTVLASWAELRHDTILYAKQSYTPTMNISLPNEKPVVGYVEPVLEFYTRIFALTTMTKDGLTSLNVLNQTEKNRLQSLESILERLIDISKKELENQELTDDDYNFIKNFGENLDGIVTGVKDKGKETTMVADVHTDQNTQKCLEEGVGYVDLILVAYKVPDGRIIMGAGPVFSYYEFKHPMDDRLTDEAWKDMLKSGQTPDRPNWVSSFVAE